MGINAVSGALEGGGYGDRLLCAVFSFEDERKRPLYWIYNYKRGSFYPFVPAAAGAAGQYAMPGPARAARTRAATTSANWSSKLRSAASCPSRPSLSAGSRYGAYRSELTPDATSGVILVDRDCDGAGADRARAPSVQRRRSTTIKLRLSGASARACVRRSASRMPWRRRSWTS